MASGSKGHLVLEETNLEPRITMHTTDGTVQGPQIMPSMQYSLLTPLPITKTSGLENL